MDASRSGRSAALAAAALAFASAALSIYWTLGGTGSVLVVAGALVLAGVIDPAEPVDEYALRWHVLVRGHVVRALGRRAGVRGLAPAAADVARALIQAATEASASTARS